MRTNSHSSPQSPSSSVSLRTLLPHTAMKRHVVEHNELCFARRLQTLLLSKPHAPLPSPPRLLQMQAVLPLPSAARSSSPWSSTTLTIPSYLLRCCPTASDLIAWPGRRRSGPASLAPPPAICSSCCCFRPTAGGADHARPLWVDLGLSTNGFLCPATTAGVARND